MKPKETILLAGSNGLLGQKLTNLLAGRPAIRLIACSRGPNRNPEHTDYSYENADLSKPEEVKRLFTRHAPTVVINAAGLTQVDVCETDPTACELANLTLVANLLAPAKDYGSRFIQLSTDFVFDGTAGPYTEQAPPNPLNVYGRTKLAAEQLVAESGLEHAIVRTILVYGTAANLSRSNLLLWARDNLLAKTPIRVVNDQYRMPTLVEDLADAVLAVLMRRRSGLYHVSGAELLSIHEIVLRAAAFWKLPTRLITPVTTAELHEKALRPARTGFVILKAQTELGFNPRSLEDGLALLDRQFNG